MKRIAIFASGSGTNAQKIIEYFSASKEIFVDSLWANNENAYALIRAEKLGIEISLSTEMSFTEATIYWINYTIAGLTSSYWPDFYGYMVPRNLTELFTVINIHPALLPKKGGKGMYGMNVHKAVLDSKDKESGITIHQVNQDYDKGKIIFQATCQLCPGILRKHLLHVFTN